MRVKRGIVLVSLQCCIKLILLLQKCHLSSIQMQTKPRRIVPVFGDSIQQKQSSINGSLRLRITFFFNVKAHFQQPEKYIGMKNTKVYS